MRFWDSSAIVPLIVAEASTKLVQAIAGDDPVMCVWWATEVECVSALARREREDVLSERSITIALERLDALAASWHEGCRRRSKLVMLDERLAGAARR